MKTLRIGGIWKVVFAGVGALALSVSPETQAARSVAPSNGSPATLSIAAFGKFNYLNGTVLHTNTLDRDTWILTTQRDTTSTIGGAFQAQVFGRTGGNGPPLTCFGVATAPDGTTTSGTTKSITAGCTGAIGFLSTGAVSVVQGHSAFYVSCSMPPMASCPSQITSFVQVGS
jgi:hypothetical protein